MAGTLHTQANKDLIRTLVEARKTAGLSQAQLAKRLGKPPSYVAKVELCERRLDVIEFCQWAVLVLPRSHPHSMSRWGCCGRLA